MRKRTTLASVALAAFAVVGMAFADNLGDFHILTQKKQKTLSLENMANSPKDVTSLKTVSTKASSTTASILVSEDFNKVTGGTTEKPDTTIMLASEWSGYSLHGMYIDSSLTNDGTWWGH